MNFFEHQDAARRRTGRLVVLFVIATVLIVVAVYLAVSFGWRLVQYKEWARPDAAPFVWWDPLRFLYIAGATVVVILSGSLYKMLELRAGGEAVALMLGGRPIQGRPSNHRERVLRNVVDEMAIASGIPAPPVYVLDQEGGINAFAAGFTPNDSVIGVTRGALELLNREELQGVIAHEFSHIFNGDTRVNIRLLGLLHGILVIALIGYGMLRVVGSSRGGSSDRKGGGGALLALLAMGVALLVIGYIGVFFGKMIQSAVSRQREHLADASGVQFTRNPAGLANALKKIGGLVAGSSVRHPQARAASHFFFGNAFAGNLMQFFSTHPPLEERIRRLDPSFDGQFPGVTRARDEEPVTAAVAAARPSVVVPAAVAAAVALEPASAVESVGTLDEAHVAYAAHLAAELPEALVEAAHEPLGAVALAYALLLDPDEEARRAQMACLGDDFNRAPAREAARMLPSIRALPVEARLPLLEMAAPALRTLSAGQYERFAGTVNRLAKADGKMTLREYALQRTLRHQLAAQFTKERRRLVHYYAVKPMVPFCAQLFSHLAYAGQSDAAGAQRAFGAGMRRLSDEAWSLLPRAEVRLDRLDDALDELGKASPAVKRRVLEAAAACIGADGTVTVREAELLRVVAASLDCPMPPILPHR
jgi:Zn-dependent protease with chaperone function